MVVSVKTCLPPCCVLKRPDVSQFLLMSADVSTFATCVVSICVEFLSANHILIHKKRTVLKYGSRQS